MNHLLSLPCVLLVIALLGLPTLMQAQSDVWGGSDGKGDEIEYRSAGAELTSDLRLFSWPIPFDVGLRYAYRFKNDEPRFDVIIGVVGL